MKKKMFAWIALALVGIILFSSISYLSLVNNPKSQERQFYLGVTFGGDTTSEAKLLIDKVKSYSNLFVLQSGVIQQNLTKMEDVCDYAVASGLNLLIYFGVMDSNHGAIQSFLDIAVARWGNSFLGIYYGDEPGGKMLDSNLVTLYDRDSKETITKQPGATSVTRTITTYFTREDCLNYIQTKYPDRSSINFAENGFINLEMSNGTIIKYYSNGTITKSQTTNLNGTTTMNLTEETFIDKNVAPKVGTYNEAWLKRPFQTFDDTAELFIKHFQSSTEWLRNQSVNLFTSDYGLYWYDYLGGYSVVLAQFGWNQTTERDVALVRGAAELQNKSWGVILTWKYTEPPYLANGDEIYNQLCLAYNCGAKYAVIFNYPTVANNKFGVLQEEHFQALNQFWNQVLHKGDPNSNKIKAEAVLVLPFNYGGGLRKPDDIIWGLWHDESISEQIWWQVQNKLAQYGPKLDIVYDFAEFPMTGRYGKIFSWNQTG
jgi:hypothetical protein